MNLYDFYKSTNFKSVAFTIPPYPLSLARYINIYHYEKTNTTKIGNAFPGEHKSEARPFALKRVFININFIIFININFIIGPTPGVKYGLKKLSFLSDHIESV